MFYAESLYLKLPKRIMALIMVMALSLLCIFLITDLRNVGRKISSLYSVSILLVSSFL